MCTYSSFWNAETNWFDWFSMFITILSILLAWYASYYFYNKAKKQKEKEDKELLEQEYLFFKKNIEKILPVINRQIEVFNQFPRTQQFNRTISIDTAFMSYFDLKSFYVKNGLNKKNKIELDILNDLLINLNTLNDYYNKEKTVYLELQKTSDLAPKLNIERRKAIEDVKSSITVEDLKQNQKELLKKYLELLENNPIDFRKLNDDIDNLTKTNNDPSLLFKKDNSYRTVRTDFANSKENFESEFGILISNLQDAKASIEKYLKIKK